MSDRSAPRVAVLGVGLIGGSIGLAARARLGAEVAGYDPDPATREAALATGAADTATDSVAAACEGAEVVFCAAPVGRLPELVAAALAAAGPEAAITDVGSTKRGIVAAVGADERFIGGHPLAGAETAGVANARADLFEGATWYLTPTAGSDGVLYDRLQRAVAGLGARPQAIDAAGHDRLMATVSGMPHAVANALVAEAAADLASGERVPEVGPSFRDATRVAGSNPAIWADIFASNSRGGRRLGRRRGAPPRRGRGADPLRRHRGDRRLARRRRRGPPPPARSRAPRRPAARAPPDRRQQAGDDGDPGAGAGRGRGEHRGHGALPGPGHDLRRGLALGRGGGAGRARRRPGSANWATR